MRIKNSNEFGNLTEIEMKDFEEANGIELPEDYRDFLLSYNGGEPEPNRVRVPETILTYLFGMHNGEYYASLYKCIDIYRLRIPFSTLPIGRDPFGNIFLMSIHPEGLGHIYFWDHEREPEVQDGHNTENCVFVAYSFTEFIDSLY